MMTPQELKNSILQLAIQGKLVEQRPEEQPVCLDGLKIKKTDEYEFDLPEQWITGNIETITSSVPTKQYQILESQVGKEGKYPVISQSKDYSIGFTNDIEKLYTHTNPVIIFGDHTTVVKLVDFDFVVGADGVKIFYPVEDVVSAEFLYYVMQYFTFGLEKIGGYSRHYKYIKDRAFPLPPLAEQKRIVAKIEELLPLIDRYEAAWTKLEEFNRRFPGDMQKSLLQMAIQGKLVEQRSEEGSAEELYREIQKEKQALIKVGKIKKEKPLPEITEDEKPFEIPEGWKWVHVGEVFAHNTGKAMNSSAKKVEKAGSIRKFITTSNLYWNEFDLSSVKEMFFSDDELERCTITKGDLLMNEGGAYFGRTAIWDFDYDICFQNHVHRLRPYSTVELMFFYYVFYFYRNMNMMRAKGTAMPGLSSVTLHEMVIPLPPLSEQKRIVARLEELLPLCEGLK